MLLGRYHDLDLVRVVGELDVDLEDIFTTVSCGPVMQYLDILSVVCSSFASPFAGTVTSPFTMAVEGS